MPRSSGGTYTLYTPGNPVVSNTVISSSWANNTLTDIATAMTDSLSRSGQGAMLAPLQLVDGTVSAPGLTWGTETASGWYRKAANSFSFSISGAEKANITANAFALTNAAADMTASVTNSGSAVTAALSTVGASSLGFAGTTTNHAFHLYTNNTSRFSISNAGAVAIPGALDVTGTLSGTTIAASTGLTIATVSVRDATNLFTSGTVPAARLPSSFAGLANPAATIGLTAVNGSAATAMRSDGAPALSQAIAPTWTAQHIFSSTSSSGAVRIDNAAPTMGWFESDAAAGSRLWRATVNSLVFTLQATDDGGGSASSVFDATRSGASISTVNFPNGVLQYGGIEVGYRDIPRVTQSGNYTLLSSDRGKLLLYAGAGGHTYTIPSFAANSVITVLNVGSGNLTLAGSGITVNWFAGSGSVPTGSRTLGVGGVATLWAPNTVDIYVWGVGLT